MIQARGKKRVIGKDAQSQLRLHSVLIVGAVLLPSAASANCEAGRIFSVSGNVLIRYLKDTSRPAKVARVGDCVQRGSVINTASNGRAKLLLEDRSVIDLGGSTSYHFEELKVAQKTGMENRDVSMSVDYGKVRASVNTPITGSGRFKVRTRAATMGVRGTEFVVDAGSPLDAGSSAGASVTVLSGKVEVQENLSTAAPGAGKSVAPTSAPIVLTQAMQANIVTQGASAVMNKPSEPSGGMGKATLSDSSGQASSDGSASSKGGGSSVLKLNSEQLDATRSAASVPDQTFEQSVVIEKDSSETGNALAAGDQQSDSAAPITAAATESTLALVAESVTERQEESRAQESASAPLLQDLGIAGTFSTDTVVESSRPTDLNVAQPYTVRVILRIPNQ